MFGDARDGGLEAGWWTQWCIGIFVKNLVSCRIFLGIRFALVAVCVSLRRGVISVQCSKRIEVARCAMPSNQIPQFTTCRKRSEVVDRHSFKLSSCNDRRQAPFSVNICIFQERKIELC